jgi:hypothetical protein
MRDVGAVFEIHPFADRAARAFLRQHARGEPGEFRKHFIVGQRVLVMAARIVGGRHFLLAAARGDFHARRDECVEFCRQGGVFRHFHPIGHLMHRGVRQVAGRKKIVAEAAFEQHARQHERQAVIGGLARRGAPLFGLAADFAPREPVSKDFDGGDVFRLQFRAQLEGEPNRRLRVIFGQEVLDI